MKVLILNGSPKANGNTAVAICKMVSVFEENGIEAEVVLARNMIFLMKSIALGKEQFGLPETEPHLWTNFI